MPARTGDRHYHHGRHDVPHPARPGHRPARRAAGRSARSAGARGRTAHRVPPGAAVAAVVLRVDARLPDEQERLRGDGRPTAGRGLRGGAVDGCRGPGRHQHLRHPRERRGEGDRAAGAPRAAQGRQPGHARRDDRLLRPRVQPGGAGTALPGRGPVPAPGRGARAGGPARARIRAGARGGPGDDRGDHGGQGLVRLGRDAPRARAGRGDR